MPKKYPDVLTPAKRKKYDAAMKEIHPDLKRISEEIRRSQQISAEDLAIVINAR